MFAGDLFHLPSIRKRFQTFYSVGKSQAGVEDILAQQWKKPRGASYVYILLVGPGGGGGGGKTGIAGTGRGGGAGGGSGAVASLMIPAMALPDTLFVTVAKGGLGGASGAAGALGASTKINIFRPFASIDVPTTIAYARYGQAGAAGATSGSAASGSVAGGMTFNSPFLASATLQENNGVTGGAGGNAVGANPGSSVQMWTNSFVSGGAGGGSVSTANVEAAGGPVNVASNVDFVAAILGGLVAGGAGSKGIELYSPILCSSGGSGGGGNAGGTGGAGGDGGFGSGGAGGGGGLTGGAGGKGGDGLVVIGWW